MSGRAQPFDEQTHVRELDFDGLRIAYDDRIIEPRPWTAAQSRWARDLERYLPAGPVLEVCAGAGHIGLLAVHTNERELTQIDIDPVACEYAASNARRAGMSGRVDVRCGSMHDVLTPQERFVLIIADPPYLPTQSVSRFPLDPRLAIDGGTDGFDLIASCLLLISRHLADGGGAVLQVSDLAQAEVVAEHLLQRPQLGITAVDERDCGRGGLVHLVRREG